MTVKIEIVAIGPDYALKLLENNDHNRRMDFSPEDNPAVMPRSLTRREREALRRQQS